METESNSYAGRFGLKDEEWMAFLSEAFGAVFTSESVVDAIDVMFKKMNANERAKIAAFHKAAEMKLYAEIGRHDTEPNHGNRGGSIEAQVLGPFKMGGDMKDMLDKLHKRKHSHKDDENE